MAAELRELRALLSAIQPVLSLSPVAAARCGPWDVIDVPACARCS